MDVEKEFQICVDLVGGIQVTSLVGKSPSFDNADFLFPQYKVVSELKCFEEDKIVDQKIVEKASQIYFQYFSEGKVPEHAKGQRRITTTDEFPDNLKKELIDLYMKPIHRVIKKANKQLRETKENLKIHDDSGLLILVNNGHSALTPDLARYILGDTFRRYSFSSIDAVLYFTTNPLSEHPSFPEQFLVWLPISLGSEKVWPAELIKRLEKAWFNRLADITGEPIRAYCANENNIEISEINNKK
jgi:hypothetical protein